MTSSKRRSTIALAPATVTLAFAAVSAPNASAAYFNISATGTFGGSQTTDQVFTFGEGSVICKEAQFHFVTISTEFNVLDPNPGVTYSNCTSSTSLGKIAATVSSPASLSVRADGEVDLGNTITLHVGAE